MVEQMTPATVTGPELLGELITLIRMKQTAWRVYIRRVETGDPKAISDIARNMWSDCETESRQAEHRLYEHMRKNALAQVVTVGVKARIENVDSKPLVSLFKVTGAEEERWNV